ncbi:PDT domain-containing protein [Verticillium alfalfae VaMs.102]|uniref:prephenate dehydratase n=1 Tax=Verticillium alfalfae (strain VaMs.102 / ATCC MYA-4576 / FGSC 10136) TaxID=526221 RepID=C9SPD4_VERA1|nr:PDT domain-containing protein [Verticillium alfalfae VaMs.102]EEY20649.1 PDT domain-containing protein [Verticillium alfalfae VaMs.102]
MTQSSWPLKHSAAKSRAKSSSQASLQVFPESDWELKPLVTIPDIFTAVQAGHVTYGVVPFENSTNGSVVFTLDCFADRHALSPDISVCGENYLDVHHFLVGHLPPNANTAGASKPVTATPESTPVAPTSVSALSSASAPGSGACTPTASEPHPPKPRAKPLTDLTHIRRLYSHPQAWGQCSAFLQTYLKGIEAIDVSSTSRAAALVAEDETGTSAAISSEIAAQLHGIDILAASIEDRSDNTTRFFVIRKENVELSKTPLPPKLCQSDVGTTKSMVSFMVPHTAPGALADVLSAFRAAGLNLTSINSRPSLEEPFQYVFFVEFEGHRVRDPDGRVRDALEGVARVAETWRWLGSWEDQRSRP